MAYINLLPWREQRRQQRNKQFLKIIYLSITLGLLGVSAVWGYLNHIQRSQQQTNADLMHRNSELEKTLAETKTSKQQRHTTIMKINRIYESKNNRKLLVHIWNEIANTLPNTLRLTGLKRQGELITFSGRAESTASVSDWASRLALSQGIQKVQIQSVKQVKTGGLSIFQENIDQENNYQKNKRVAQTVAEQPPMAVNDLATPFEFVVIAEVVDITRQQIELEQLVSSTLVDREYITSINQSDRALSTSSLDSDPTHTSLSPDGGTP